MSENTMALDELEQRVEVLEYDAGQQIIANSAFRTLAERVAELEAWKALHIQHYTGLQERVAELEKFIRAWGLDCMPEDLCEPEPLPWGDLD